MDNPLQFCPCPDPVSGPGTLTDYTELPTLYRLCRDCGLPMRDTGGPAPEIWVGEVQRTGYTMRRETR